MGDRAVCRDEDHLASGGNLTPAEGGGASTSAESSTNGGYQFSNQRPISAQRRFSPLRSAFIGSAVCAIIIIVLGLMAKGLGLSAWIALPLAALFGSMIGTWVGGSKCAVAYHDEQRQIKRYLEFLRGFRVRVRSESLDSLRVESPCRIGQLSEEVHRLVTEVYSGYSESIHLRRTMEHTIEKETKKAANRLTHIAFLDGLTALSNRRALDELVPEMLVEWQRADFDTVCLTIDVDYFKEVNDRIGHDRGDAILRFLADAIRSIIRDSDLAFRLGGDEFLVFLIHVGIDESAAIAERLQRQFAQLPWTDAMKRVCQKPSLSIGGASLKYTSAESVDDLLKYSDDAMYEAKRAGKGRENIVGARSREAA